MHNGKLRVGLVGAGGIGRDQHLPAWAAVPFAEVVALADTAPPALDQAGRIVPDAVKLNDWRKLIERDLDVVDICTPNRTHTEIALAALGSDKHVLCEKPLTTSTAEAVRAGTPSPVPPEETVEVTRNLEALYRSGAEQREVLLEPPSANENGPPPVRWSTESDAVLAR